MKSLYPDQQSLFDKYEDTIYDVLFPKAKRDRFKDDKFEFGMMEHSAMKLTGKIHEEILKLIPNEIIELMDKE